MGQALGERAAKLAPSRNLSEADLAAAHEDGKGMQIIADQQAGMDFANACKRLYSATPNSASTVSLNGEHVLVMEKCAGFFGA